MTSLKAEGTTLNLLRSYNRMYFIVVLIVKQIISRKSRTVTLVW